MIQDKEEREGEGEREKEERGEQIDRHEGDMHNGELGADLHQMPPVKKEEEKFPADSAEKGSTYAKL